MENEYVRIGVDYYRKIKKPDRYGVPRIELKRWKKEEMILDKGKSIVYNIPKYNDFIMLPSNKDYKETEFDCYNLYKPFPHKPKAGGWEWTAILLKHVFGDQYNLGIRYCQALYLHPERMLPILVLVSRERQTGKTTFINWLNMIFGDNMVNITPEDLKSSFNGIYATSNIIAIEETIIEKTLTIEKLKALATGKFLSVNAKWVSEYRVPFYGKIIMASNNEDKFARIDEEEIRFFIRKLQIPQIENHDIESDLLKEIPAFLHYLDKLPAIDWSRDRSGFTPNELNNESLKMVKQESRSALYKDLYELLQSHFSNVCPTKEVIYATPGDIKDKWFPHNSRVEIQYIKQVLRREFRFESPEKSIRYWPLGIEVGVEKKVGRPFTITRSTFLTDEEAAQIVTNIEPIPF